MNREDDNIDQMTEFGNIDSFEKTKISSDGCWILRDHDGTGQNSLGGIRMRRIVSRVVRVLDEDLAILELIRRIVDAEQRATEVSRNLDLFLV